MSTNTVYTNQQISICELKHKQIDSVKKQSISRLDKHPMTNITSDSLTQDHFLDEESYRLAQQNPEISAAVVKGFNIINATMFKDTSVCYILKLRQSSTLAVRYCLKYRRNWFRAFNLAGAYSSLYYDVTTVASSDIVLN